jgi:hypothetical protein
MSTEYSIGRKRFLACKTEDEELVVSIYETDSYKFINLPLKRWARFLLKLDAIDEQLEYARQGKIVDFQTHIGGKLYVSINSSLKWTMVDFREFYMHPTKGIRATKRGISLHYDEFQKLKNCLPTFHAENECARTAKDCLSQPDHQNQQGMDLCEECNPFAFNLMCVSTSDPMW